MTICDKINDVGETLQENLNNRGVDCTFGTGTGESTVLDMVEMVNGTNFKGSSDVNLKIGANRPYLLTGETTDVIVRLEDGLCEPLKNESVTVSDGTNTVNGVTDGKGEFALYGVSVTDNTTFTATYGTETATTNVYLCQFADYGITSNSNLSYWYWNSTYGSGSVGTDGTTFTATSSSSYITVSATLTSPSTSSIYIYDFPLTVEFDIVSYNDPSGVTDYSRVRVYNNANNKNCYWDIKNYGIGHYKIVCSNGSQKLYFNGVEQSRSFTFTPTTAWNVAFQSKGYIKFHNFAIY